MWTEDEFHFKGDFYRINGDWVKPKPISSPHPEIFQGGNSKAARRMASCVSDWYFMNGNTLSGVREQIEEVSALAQQEGPKVKFGLNAFTAGMAINGRTTGRMCDRFQRAECPSPSLPPKSSPPESV
jgi:alkanesulfonate monooxygenase SsuD/methylene tetrahydromethanopterin reductase-like flavin-dependent oxidoreductase (luciferase family)